MNEVENKTIKYSHALEEELLPKMGSCGIWNSEVPATVERKRNLLYVIARRKAKLFDQIKQIKEKKEYYRFMRKEN